MQVVTSGGQMCKYLQVMRSGGQLCNLCKWCHLMANKLFQITFSQKLIQVRDAIPWVRCASGNVCSILCLCFFLCSVTKCEAGFPMEDPAHRVKGPSGKIKFGDKIFCITWIEYQSLPRTTFRNSLTGILPTYFSKCIKMYQNVPWRNGHRLRRSCHRSIPRCQKDL